MNSKKTSHPPAQYVATVTGLTEITLMGTADLSFWHDILRLEGHYPYSKDGRAEIVISAIDSKWMGFKFKELTISISISQEEEEAQPAGFFLVQAFNSSKVLGFMERTFFQTPYASGEIALNASPALSISVGTSKRELFHAEMGAARPTSSGEDDEWEGPIYLRAGKGDPSRKQKVFYARLAGRSERSPYLPSLDRTVIKPSGEHEVFQQLFDSAFSGAEWRVRHHATHARSRTFTIET